MTPRQLPRAAITGFVLVIAVGAVLLWRSTSSSPESSSSPAAQGASDAVASARSPNAPASSPQAAAPQEKSVKREQIPMPGCWEGLLELDKTASLDALRAALAQAISNKDPYLASYLQERLTEVVGNDSARALQVLEWAAQAAGPELNIYMDALKAAPAVRHPSVSERLLKLGEDKTAHLPNRAAALNALETQHRFSPEAVQRLKAIALDTSADSAAWVATRTLGRVMKEDYERTGTYAPYWQELLDIGGKAEDQAVRMLALEMPSYSDPILDSASIDKLSELMRKDPEKDVREMAAFRLAVTEDPQKALEAYRAAFDGEQELCVRWAMLRFAIRAAGAEALPVVAEFAKKDPRLQQDYEDFKRLYAEGTVDFARIWVGKEERHNCTVEEGAPHQ
ncbi:MAG TPA: HEAT repeat domain-containing protein [Hyalangium sp.]|nr:HEAT repeat domain-containing protein [Hyalangium sp.]